MTVDLAYDGCLDVGAARLYVVFGEDDESRAVVGGVTDRGGDRYEAEYFACANRTDSADGAAFLCGELYGVRGAFDGTHQYIRIVFFYIMATLRECLFMGYDLGDFSFGQKEGVLDGERCFADDVEVGIVREDVERDGDST